MQIVLFDSELLLQKLKKEKNWVTVAAILVLASILIGVLPFVLSGLFSGLNVPLFKVSTGLLLVVVGLLVVLVIIKSLFFAFIIRTLMHTLTANKHGFYEALSSIAIFDLWFSYGLFLTGVLLSIQLPFLLNLFFALILLAFFLVKSLAVLFRSIKEMYEVEYQTVIMAVIIVLIVGLLMFFLLFFLLILGLVFAALSIISSFMKGLQ